MDFRILSLQHNAAAATPASASYVIARQQDSVLNNIKHDCWQDLARWAAVHSRLVDSYEYYWKADNDDTK